LRLWTWFSISLKFQEVVVVIRYKTIQVSEHFHRRDSCPGQHLDEMMVLVVALIVGVDGPGKLMRVVMSTGAHPKWLAGVFEQPL
jgi:hypothetical protein